MSTTSKCTSGCLHENVDDKFIKFNKEYQLYRWRTEYEKFEDTKEVTKNP